MERPGSIGVVERCLQLEDGSRRWVDGIATNLLHDPNVRAVVVNLKDVTERKLAEEALRESEQRFRDYAEMTSDWFWETGHDHRFTTFRGAVAGIDARNILGATRWELAKDLEEEPEKWRAHRTALDAHQPFRGFTYRLARSDGIVGYVSTSGRPVFDQGEHFLGYRGTSTDVTARQVRPSRPGGCSPPGAAARRA